MKDKSNKCNDCHCECHCDKDECDSCVYMYRKVYLTKNLICKKCNCKLSEGN